MAMMTRSDPFGEVVSLRDAVNQLLADSVVAPFSSVMRTTTMMPVDLYETDEAFVVKAFMPGITADQLNISIEQNIVTIHGEPKADQWENMRPILIETNLGAFTRKFMLPGTIDADKVQAELDNGVLTLTLPKAETHKPRKIQIKSS
jgi:HSP20 family protein